MKKQLVPLWILLFAAGLVITSCNKLDVTEEFELKVTIDVAGNTAQFTGETLLDAAAESDLISTYASTIKSIEIREIKYVVSQFSGTVTQQINNGTLEVADADGNSPLVISTVQNINLMNASTESDLQFDQNAVDKLANLIKNDPHQALICLKGDVNEIPVDFTVVVKFKVKMVAGVL